MKTIKKTINKPKVSSKMPETELSQKSNKYPLDKFGEPINIGDIVKVDGIELVVRYVERVNAIVKDGTYAWYIDFEEGFNGTFRHQKDKIERILVV